MDHVLVSRADNPSGITRRRLLAAGGAAGAAAVATLNPQLAKAANAVATFGEPAYLRRSSYPVLLGTDFTAVAPQRVTFSLASVGDLEAAATVERLRGRDDAFSLVFLGPSGLPAGTRSFSHQFLCAFELFLSPIDRPSGGQAAYEAVIDRSIGVDRKKAPKPGEKPKKPRHRRRRRRRRRSHGGGHHRKHGQKKP